LGINGGGFTFLERAVEAAANIVVPSDGGKSTSVKCTQEELDSFNLMAMCKIVMYGA
jgi:hypothetical protein